MTTTAKEIRDVMVTAVHGITPLLYADQKFLQCREDGGDFLEWCERNPEACFRRFSIRRVSGVQPALVSNCDIEQVETVFQLVVAYPRRMQPGDVDHPAELGLDDLIESDETQLISTIGTPGYSTIDTQILGDACVRHGATEIDEGDAVRFLVIPLDVMYWRDMPSA